MKINLKVTKKHTLDELESYTIQDICLVLNCGTRTAQNIKNSVIKSLVRKGVIIKNASTYRVKRTDLLQYLSKRHIGNDFDDDMGKKNKDILDRSLINVNDLRILLNCSVHIATKIINDVRKDMINKGMEPILHHVLTSYVLIYIENEKIAFSL